MREQVLPIDSVLLFHLEHPNQQIFDSCRSKKIDELFKIIPNRLLRKAQLVLFDVLQQLVLAIGCPGSASE
jgi:hypothetical protein